MHRLFIPTFGPTDWRRLLADPKKHWREKRSAYELAISWEAARGSARGLPPSIARLLDEMPKLVGATLLLGIPEHQVVLEGGGHPSQTDLWGILSAPCGLISMAIEGKAGESFDLPVREWLQKGSSPQRTVSPRSGKPARLAQLCNLLEIERDQVEECRYQLLHRTASAILEAKRFRAEHAIFLVQSFADDPVSLSDYIYWARQLGVVAGENKVVSAGARGGIHLWLAWVTCEPCDDQTLRAAIG